MSKKKSGPKVLFFDIETAPMEVFAWGLFDQNIGLNQIKKDWYVLSWSARWLGESKVMYEDLRQGTKDFSLKNEKKLLAGIWRLLDQADVVVTQNGVRFDSKKLNARFIINGMKKPSSYKHFDTLKVAKKHFAFTSFKLEYMAKALDVKFKKLAHKKFPGFDLWAECLLNNQEAWKEMERYNKRDVLTLQSVYEKLAPFDGDETINFNIFKDNQDDYECKCGSTSRNKYGFAYTKNSKYQRFKCMSCGAETRSKKAIKT